MTLNKADEILPWLLEATATLRMYHWQTRSLARHLNMDLLLKAWAPLTDQLAEALLGLRPRLKLPQVALQIALVSDESAVALLKNYRGFLRDLRLESELRSIRDDLVASLDQALYRCTLT